MIRFSDLEGNPVMSTSTATTVGRIGSVVLDPEARRVVAFTVKKSKGPGDVLLWEGITAIGPDVVTVDSEDRVADPPEALKDTVKVDLKLIGHRVLTDHGRDVGKLKDVEFDPADGRIVTLMVKEQYVEGERLLGIGSYAVVVRA